MRRESQGRKEGGPAKKTASRPKAERSKQKGRGDSADEARHKRNVGRDHESHQLAAAQVLGKEGGEKSESSKIAEEPRLESSSVLSI